MDEHVTLLADALDAMVSELDVVIPKTIGSKRIAPSKRYATPLALVNEVMPDSLADEANQMDIAMDPR